jgi:predicted O-methyltransferase YrrM
VPRSDALRILAARVPALRALPPRIALFHGRALGHALRVGDAFALQSATRPADVAHLVELARGRRHVVELGTAVGWTTGALALADPARRVLSFDPVAQPHRDAYLRLLHARARARIRLVQAAGADGAGHADDPVDLLFVDSTHERDATIAEVEAWRAHLAPGAIIVLHDYDNPAFPGVRAAVEALALPGAPSGGSFVSRA